MALQCFVERVEFRQRMSNNFDAWRTRSGQRQADPMRGLRPDDVPQELPLHGTSNGGIWRGFTPGSPALECVRACAPLSGVAHVEACLPGLEAAIATDPADAGRKRQADERANTWLADEVERRGISSDFADEVPLTEPVDGESRSSGFADEGSDGASLGASLATWA